MNAFLTAEPQTLLAVAKDSSDKEAPDRQSVLLSVDGGESFLLWIEAYDGIQRTYPIFVVASRKYGIYMLATAVAISFYTGR